MRKNKYRLWLVISVLMAAMMACSLPSLAMDFFNRNETQEPPTTTEVVETPEEIVKETQVSPTTNQTTIVIPDEVLLQDALIELYENVSRGVVSIQVYSETSSGLGSGFVIDKEGHIVTNYHVVDGADEVEVHFPSGLKVFGEVVGVDLDSDLAVIKVDVDQDQLYPLIIGDSDQLRVGQTVVAIGNPYGLTGTMTLGIVSARGRTLESIRQTESGSFFSAGDLIQTDANINPGNSGGPLLNLNGEVIGINRAIQTSGNITNYSNTGIGFAVSSNILRLVVPTLKLGEEYQYPYLGLSSYDSLTLAQAELLGLDQATGAYIAEVVEGGPADQAGLQSGTRTTDVFGLLAGGDLIIAVDGEEILEFSELLSYLLLNKQPGDTIDLTVLRGGEEITFTVTLGERPGN